MEENKYYTPCFEEFCVGLEYEIQYPRDFEKRIFGGKDEECFVPWYEQQVLIDMIEDKEVRVKYLDSDDIRELGFTDKSYRETMILPAYHYEYTKIQDNIIYFIIYNFKTKVATIYVEPNNTIEPIFNVGFNGVIRNKSELKKVLAMLNIKIIN